MLVQVLDTFLAAKQKADSTGEGQGAAPATMEALHGLTTLRATLSAGLLSGGHFPPLPAGLLILQGFPSCFPLPLLAPAFLPPALRV